MQPKGLKWHETEDFLTRWTGVTLSAYRHWLHQFRDFCQSRSANCPNQVTPQHLEEYRKWLTWQPNRNGQMNKPNTVFLGMRVARSFLRCCQIPAASFLLSAPSKTKPDLLTPAELAQVLKPIGHEPRQLRDFLVVLVIAVTNLGPKDCCGLNLESPLELDENQQSSYLAYLRQGRPQLTGSNPCSALFLAQGRRLSVPMLTLILLQAGERAGLKRRLSPRLLRQSYRHQLERLSENRTIIFS